MWATSSCKDSSAILEEVSYGDGERILLIKEELIKLLHFVIGLACL